ncbi:MAG TPA: Flp family type IVb pilin [Pseudonocardiaceae bacterium]|jgi:pilus assembly protein Flp/PilA
MLTLFSAWLRERLEDDRGATAVEYGLLIAGIAALVVVALITFGPAVAGAFTDLIDDLS